MHPLWHGRTIPELASELLPYVSAESPAVRAAALKNMGAFKDPSLQQVYFDRLLRETDTEVIEAAIWGLGFLGNPDHWREVAPFENHADENVRNAVRVTKERYEAVTRSVAGEKK